MTPCEKCGRPLRDDDQTLCPACRAKKSYSVWNWVKGAVAVVAVVAAAAYAILTRGGNDT